MISTPLKTSDISIIIPTLNEESNIRSLAENLAGGDYEIILVDGGSRDETVRRAKDFGLTVIPSTPGRAVQMNCGAQASTGRVLLFLHADTLLPSSFAGDVVNALQEDTYSAGAFRLSISQTGKLMRFICACANLRSSLLQLPYGDQAIFMRKDTFMRLGMFPELPIMEDYVFIKKAQKEGKITLLQKCVITSARRWEKLGIFRTTIINQMVVLGYHLGIPPHKLSLLYRR